MLLEEIPLLTPPILLEAATEALRAQLAVAQVAQEHTTAVPAVLELLEQEPP
jgi:hypothetical protein